jgi:hypothetical protein
LSDFMHTILTAFCGNIKKEALRPLCFVGIRWR